MGGTLSVFEKQIVPFTVVRQIRFVATTHRPIGRIDQATMSRDIRSHPAFFIKGTPCADWTVHALPNQKAIQPGWIAWICWTAC